MWPSTGEASIEIGSSKAPLEINLLLGVLRQFTLKSLEMIHILERAEIIFLGLL